MKILEVGSSLYDWGGIERYVLYLSQGLTARGHEVEATCPSGSPLDKRLGITRHHLPLKSKHSLLGMARYLRLLRSRKYDLIHVHFSPDFLMPAYAARLVGGVKVVLTRHLALKWSPGKVRLYSPLFDHIIPVSHASEKKLLESGIPQDRMTVAKAGCPALARSWPIEETRANSSMSGFAVGSFGRLAKGKGIEVLLAAQSAMEAQVHLFGDGPLRASLEGLKGSARFHGFVPDVADAMGAVDVVAIPSTWEEAFPYAALEAMSLGRPLLASRVGGLPEMVEEGVNGLLFESGNSADLAAKASILEGDLPETRRMGERGQQLHADEYTVEKMAARIEAVFQAVV